MEAEVVGTVLVGPAITPAMLIGDGALVTVEQMQALSDGQPVRFLLADVAPGVGVDDAIAELRQTWGRGVDVPVRAPEIGNLQRVRAIPVALAATLAVAALALDGAVLVLSRRRRAVALATLQAIGATRQQLRAALAWQAGWLYAVAVAVGVPLGLIAGRLLWRLVADGIGVLIGPSVPIVDIVTIVLVGLVAIVAVGLVPGARLGDRHAMRALRAE